MKSLPFCISMVVIGLLSATPSNAGSGPCGTDPALIHLSPPPRAVKAALLSRTELHVIAFGSSSTQGHGASRPSFAYPAQLEVALRGRHPHLSIRVENKGVGGETAEKMLLRLERDVILPRPDLVIWQVSANEALRQVDPAVLLAALRDGLDRLRGAGIEVVLMPMQYAPRILQAPRLDAYLAAIQVAASEYKAPVFPRFEIVRRAIVMRKYRFEDLFTSDGLHHNDVGYRCLARQLAVAVG